MEILGLGWKVRTDGHINKTLPLCVYFFCKWCKKISQIMFNDRRPQNWSAAGKRQFYLTERFRPPRCRNLSEQSTVISCSRRLITVALKANDTPSRARSLQQTGCFVHGTFYTVVPAFVTSTFTPALQTTRLFTQLYLSIRLLSVTNHVHNVTPRQHDLYQKCVSKITPLYSQTFVC